MRLPVCLTAITLLAGAPTAVAQRIGPPPPAETGTTADAAPEPASDHSIDCLGVRDLRFAAGKTETTVSDAVARDDAEHGCYTFVARKGQTFDARLVDDSTPNSAILIFRPGYALQKDDDFQYMDGPVLPGAGRDDAARHVHAVLPATGRYLIMMGPTRGGAAGYTLRIRIR